MVPRQLRFRACAHFTSCRHPRARQWHPRGCNFQTRQDVSQASVRSHVPSFVLHSRFDLTSAKAGSTYYCSRLFLRFGKCRIFLVAIRQMALPGRVEISRKTYEIAEGTFSTVGIQLFLFPDGLFLFGACREHHMASTTPVTNHRHFDVDLVVLV